ncbi:hypothetical protein CEXT_192141 [Caerostris extrusa]|uniref:Uncharacterized protein n=1 Tax=Caerostris extrusa TaxID=172846 RepID=A0AAV4P2X6_CAEEX|nr:hypothetical protein CEXT_192141 [Caerostris extrusa]
MSGDRQATCQYAVALLSPPRARGGLFPHLGWGACCCERCLSSQIEIVDRIGVSKIPLMNKSIVANVSLEVLMKIMVRWVGE